MEQAVRLEQLRALKDKLRLVVEAFGNQLEGYQAAHWFRVFGTFYEDCEQLEQHGFSQGDLNVFSASLMQALNSKVFDYYPGTYVGKARQYRSLPEAKVQQLERALDGLNDLALSLRVIS